MSLHFHPPITIVKKENQISLDLNSIHSNHLITLALTIKRLILVILIVLPSLSFGESQTISNNKEVVLLFDKGIGFLIKNKLEKAEFYLSKALEIEPQNGKIHWEMGWVFWKKQQWDKAIYYWDRTRLYYPDQKDLNSYYEIAEKYLKLEKESSVEFNSPPSIVKKNTADNNISFSAVGDIMMGSNYPDDTKLPPNNGEHIFEKVRDFLQGDIVFGNLEGPITDVNITKKCNQMGKCYVFRTPPRYSSLLKEAGFDILNLANNHSLDFGVEGMLDTARNLDRIGIYSFGQTGKSWIIIKKKGLNIGFIGVASSSCCLHVKEIKKITSIVKKLKKRTDILIVSVHGGAEGLSAMHVPYGDEVYLEENRGDMRKFSHAMIENGADVIFGHGPHTVRGLELYKKKLIVYSLGNFLGYLGFNTSGHLKYTYIINLELTPSGNPTMISIIPIKLTPQVVPIYDSEHRVIPLLNSLSREDFGKNAIILDKNGTIKF